MPYSILTIKMTCSFDIYNNVCEIRKNTENRPRQGQHYEKIIVTGFRKAVETFPQSRIIAYRGQLDQRKNVHFVKLFPAGIKLDSAEHQEFFMRKSINE